MKIGATPDRETLDGYREAGIDRSILPLPSADRDRDKVLSILDRYGDLVR